MTKPKTATEQIPAPAFRTSSFETLRFIPRIVRISTIRLDFCALRARRFTESSDRFLLGCRLGGDSMALGSMPTSAMGV